MENGKNTSGIVFMLVLSSILILKCRDNPSKADIKWQQSTNNNDIKYRIITDELEIPWQMDFTGDGRVLITERKGVVKTINADNGNKNLWLDLRDVLATSKGGTVEKSGLLGIALDPKFEQNGLVYLGYAYEAPEKEYDYNKLVQYKEEPNSGNVKYQKTLLDSVKGASLHNSGQIKIGPDNKIYWSIGDRWEPESAQDPEDLSGSILRINLDGSIPADNPFEDSYVYSYGHRDAQGFDWHPVTNTLFATEHGPYGKDEINIIKPGKNYGWPDVRGDEKKEGIETPLIQSGYGEPIEDYTWAPSGATFIKEGPWKNMFLFGGLRSESLWQLQLDDDNKVKEVKELNRLFENEFGRLRSVEQGPNGNIYLITSNLDTYDLPIGKDFLIELEVNE